MDDARGGGPVEAFGCQAKFGFAGGGVAGVDRRAHFADLRLDGALGSAITCAANLILAKAFFGAFRVGHKDELGKSVP